MTAHATDWLLATARAVHFLACIVVFGELLFATAIGPGTRARARVVGAAIAAALASGAIWLCIVAVTMSGEPASVVLHGPILRRVVLDTQFGQATLVRLALAALVAAFVLSRMQRAALAAGGALLAALAWMGHAGAGAGGERVLEIGNDALHLLAAGAWLGTLPPLAATLVAQDASDAIVPVIRRYSTLGMVAVTAIVASGVVNTWFRIPEPGLLLTSRYGLVLLAKIVLVALMIALAAVNRFVVSPRVAVDPEGAGALRRNAVLEVAAGIVVVALVGVLGTLAPPMVGASRDEHAMPKQMRP